MNAFLLLFRKFADQQLQNMQTVFLFMGFVTETAGLLAQNIKDDFRNVVFRIKSERALGRLQQDYILIEY